MFLFANISSPAMTGPESEQPRPTPFQLFLYFVKLGTIGFGGPVALAEHMRRDLVVRRRWIAQQEYLDGLAFSQLAPGPLAAQLAMYLGFACNGMWGATLCAIGFILPSFTMVVALGAAYTRFQGLAWLQAAFYGVGAAVIAVIARSAIKLVKNTIGKDRLLWALFSVLLVTTAVTERENVLLFIGSGFVALAAKVGFPKLNRNFAILLPVGSLVGDSKIAQLLLYFCKASLFVFGSGLAIVPFLHGGVVEEYRWLTERQFLDAIAVAMITPGPVVITVAFIGYLVAGLPGAVAAGAGVFLPTYLLVVLCAPHYRKLAEIASVRTFIQGVTAAATGAIAGSVVVLARRSLPDLFSVLLCIVAFAVLQRTRVPEPFVILAAAGVGLALRLR